MADCDGIRIKRTYTRKGPGPHKKKPSRYDKHKESFAPSFQKLLIDNNMLYTECSRGVGVISHPYTQFSIKLTINRSTTMNYRIYKLNVLRERIIDHLLNCIDRTLEKE